MEDIKWPRTEKFPQSMLAYFILIIEGIFASRMKRNTFCI